MRYEAVIIFVLAVVAVYLGYRNKRLKSQIMVLTQGRPQSGSIKYPLTLVHLHEIANDVLQVFGETGLHPALFAVKRTLKKLGLSEDFDFELRAKTLDLRFHLERRLRRKEILECGCSSASDRTSRAEEIDRNDDEIMNYSTGLQKAERLLQAWSKV